MIHYLLDGPFEQNTIQNKMYYLTFLAKQLKNCEIYGLLGMPSENMIGRLDAVAMKFYDNYIYACLYNS